MPNEVLKVDKLFSGYKKITVLKDISLTVNKGEVVCIIGANGAGKTTLLETLAGIITHSEGSFIFNNKEMTNISAERRSHLGLKLIPEGRQVFPEMTVLENIELGAYCLRQELPNMDYKKAYKEKLEYIYELFPKLKIRKLQYAGTLSGGEQQMLAIARAMMSNYKILMFDEPSQGLAPLIIKDIFAVIKKLKNAGHTILLVEQNAKTALSIATRGYILENGRFTKEDKAENLMNDEKVLAAYLGH